MLSLVNVGSTPGLTRSMQEIQLDKNVKLLDCPGVVMIRSGANDASKTLLNCKRIEKLDDPTGPVKEILRRCPPSMLVTLYKLPSFDSVDDFLQKVATVRGKLKKGGVMDVEAAERTGLHDWNQASSLLMISTLWKFLLSCPINFDEDLLENDEPKHSIQSGEGPKDTDNDGDDVSMAFEEDEEGRNKGKTATSRQNEKLYAVEDYVKKRSAMDVGDEDDGNQIIGISLEDSSLASHLPSSLTLWSATFDGLCLGFQLLHILLSFESQSWIYIKSTRIFRSTWISIRIRCCQILYWPIFLQDNGLRSLSCVEYAEKAALRRHSMWSSLALDVLLGNLIGWALLYNAESACWWVMNFTGEITYKSMRSSCAWLMGAPAAFKLNKELAGVLGKSNLIDDTAICSSDKFDSSSENLHCNQNGGKSGILVSFLHSNFLSIGKIPYNTMPPIRNQGEPAETNIVSELGKEFNIDEVYDTESSLLGSLNFVDDLNPVEVPLSCLLNFDEDLLEVCDLS
nr:guanine nucleotide-binding protein-like nsn1 [Quercus suber]